MEGYHEASYTDLQLLMLSGDVYTEFIIAPALRPEK